MEETFSNEKETSLFILHVLPTQASESSGKCVHLPFMGTAMGVVGIAKTGKRKSDGNNFALRLIGRWRRVFKFHRFHFRQNLIRSIATSFEIGIQQMTLYREQASALTYY
jgi:hypothetical protein